MAVKKTKKNPDSPHIAANPIPTHPPTHMSEDTIGVLYNEGYGGFHLSDEAQRLYRERSGSDVPFSKRSDALMVSIVRELGPARASRQAGSKIAIETIPARYVNHYRISEYDGDECVLIQYEAYKVDAVLAILHDGQLTDAERIARITAAVLETP